MGGALAEVSGLVILLDLKAVSRGLWQLIVVVLFSFVDLSDHTDFFSLIKTEITLKFK